MKPIDPEELLGKKEYIFEEIRNMRLSICQSCNKQSHGICNLCYCSISSKTESINAFCPLRKW